MPRVVRTKTWIGVVSDRTGSQRLTVVGDECSLDGFLNAAVAGALAGA